MVHWTGTGAGTGNCTYQCTDSVRALAVCLCLAGRVFVFGRLPGPAVVGIRYVLVESFEGPHVLLGAVIGTSFRQPVRMASMVRPRLPFEGMSILHYRTLPYICGKEYLGISSGAVL